MTFIPATFHFKKRYIVYSLIFLYIVMCQSCMTMRFSNKETSKFFAPSKIEFQDKTIAFEGYKIHYVETGNAQNPTLFFVHGSPGSWNAFKEYLKDTLLLKKYRMIAIDRPGFGYSDFGDAQNLREQSQRISEFIKKNTCDVTIIHGTKDVLVPYSNVAFMQKKFTNAKSIDAITIKKANHFIPWSYYEIIRNVLLKM
ncbi:alpha/beta hydrolase [Flavobacterium sp. LS1P28]|uniref:alpha/beta fold hydrolase n=1 Tax=Flavobacterium sp. LS1P28 TaxID=2497752 RepID=UPI000F83FAEF|nr:alpha/beta hydrolase [Flavobacterium sp. LS1P28]RTY80661.1 alpha/beta hydrolase [Flavobacterium sp. LS1P28]